MQKLFPAAQAGAPAPVALEAAVALPPRDSPADIGCEELPADVPNRIESYFAGVSNGHRRPEPVTADPTT